MKLIRLLFSRFVIVGILIVVQFFLMAFAILRVGEYFSLFYGIINFLGIVVLLYLFNDTNHPSAHLPWILILIIVPFFGIIFYFFCKSTWIHKIYAESIKKIRPLLVQDESILEKLDKNKKSQSQYISRYAGYPCYENTISEYFEVGESFYEKLLEELNKAEHYIFMEYFIVEEGAMWNQILKILEDKVKQGVEVRFMYDDWGCGFKLPYKYDNVLRSKGIKTCVFNPFRPFLSVMHNNRDHRKICVIDGYRGFTGGINLADEYINVVEKYGHWKDSAIYLYGEAVFSLTEMFLENWCLSIPENVNFEDYDPHRYHPDSFESEGFYQPFGDSPMDNELVGESVYANMISNAQDYLYITTPYLIIDSELIYTLELAAKKGIDVRIITPGIPDKKIVFQITRSYYEQLIEAGVKIYEYTPGFVHAKNFIVDDSLGVVGTINLDYRSLVHHFEDGVWLCDSKTIQDMKTDFLNTLQVSREITLEEMKNVSFIKRMLILVIRIFGPLM